MKRIVLFLSFIFISHYAFGEFVCDESISDYYAIYTPNTYTCESGYFLPANTDGCRPCPTGYTCPGGTFNANSDKYQGATLNAIPTTTMNNVCADNFVTDVYAIYEPNTVTITWDDGDGNTTTGTCEYGGELTLPVEPTRAGYTFSGWKVKTNN